MMDALGPAPSGLSISIPSSSPLGPLPPLSAQEVTALLSASFPHSSTTTNNAQEELSLPPSLLVDLPPPPPPTPPPGNPLLLALSSRLLHDRAPYGSDVPFDPSKRSKWALQELEALAKRAEMDVYAESALPTSPVFEPPSQRSSQSPFATPMHTHNLLIGAGEFLIDITVSFSPSSPSPTLIALLTSQPANPRLDALLSRHLEEFFDMLGEEGEGDVDTVRIGRQLRTLERWLRELKAVEELGNARRGEGGEREREGRRWWGVVDDVAAEWEGEMNRIIEESTDPVPLDVLVSRTPVPLPYLSSPSTTFLLSLSPSSYLSLLSSSPSSPLPAPPRTTPSLPSLRTYLLPLPLHPTPLTPLATLHLSHTPPPYAPSPSYTPSLAPFPVSPAHHFALDFSPPLWIRASALAGLAVSVPQTCMVGSSNDWLAAILGPRMTPAPIYAWTGKLPGRAPKTFAVHVEYGPSGAEVDGGVQVSRIPVHSREEVRAVLDVFVHEAWLANVLRGLDPTPESVITMRGEDHIDIDSLLHGQLPTSPHIPISLQLSPLSLPTPPSSPSQPILRLTVLPHVSLEIHPPSRSAPARVVRLSPLKFADDAEWEVRASQVLRRGGLGFLVEWAWEKERERQASGLGRVEVPPVHVEDMGEEVPDIMDPELLAQVLDMGGVDVPGDIEQMDMGEDGDGGGGAGGGDGGSTFEDLFGREGEGSVSEGGGLFGTEGGDEEMGDL